MTISHPDYYETLQVHPRADAEAIRAAYERLTGLYDPARLEGAADDLVAIARRKRAEIDAAYQVLSDPGKRSAYDRAPRAAVAQASSDDRPTELLPDFRPLPPARGTERERDFANQPVVAVPQRSTSLPVAVLIGIGMLVLIMLTTLTITNWSSVAAPTAPTATAQVSAVDQYETVIAEAKQVVEQSPSDVQAWITLGNLLYDSAQIVRENMPDSVLYQQRLPRWLEASQAYAKALELEPANPAVLADKGASLCFYGAGAGEQGFVQQGIQDVQNAASVRPDDPLIQLNLGNCLISAQPPQTEAALAAWDRVLQTSPADSPLADRARELITEYRK